MKSIFLLFSLLLLVKSNFIIIPLKRYTYNYSNIKANNYNDNISEIYTNIFYTELSIGEPPQKIITFINSTKDSNTGIINKFCDSLFYLNDPSVNKNYLFENSTGFSQIGPGDLKKDNKDVLVGDQISFFKNFALTEEIKVDNISILYNPNYVEYILDDVGMDFIIEKEKRTACGYIGLRLEMSYQNNNNLVNQLKEKNIISNKVFSFLEVNKNNPVYAKKGVDYLLVMGEEIYNIFKIKDINKYINEKYVKKIYVEKSKLNDYIVNGYYFRWKLIFSNIFFNIDNNTIEMEQKNDVFLDNDYGLIAGTSEYRKIIKQTFFSKYIDNNKCAEKTFAPIDFGSFYYIICDNNININDFPELYLKSKNLQYIYQLNKNDLFIKDNNNYYFLVVFEFSRSNTWVLGKPFLRKYLFSYDYDSKSIGFYNENLIQEEKNHSNIIKYIILFSVIIILLIIAMGLGFLFGKNFYFLKKKKALEMDSPLDYDYNEINEEIKNKNKEEKIIN